jgi:hypothetical protein
MKNRSHGFGQKLRQIFRSVVRESNYRHEQRQSGSDLLNNSLTAFNFRPAIMLEFPGQRVARSSGYWQ